MSLDGRARRRKGQAGEREGAALLSGLLGRVVKRCLGQERDGGADIQIGDWHIQVKNQARWRLQEWLKQTISDTPMQGKAALMVRMAGHRGRPAAWYMVVAVEDWAEAVRDGLDFAAQQEQRGDFVVRNAIPVTWVNGTDDLPKSGE